MSLRADGFGGYVQLNVVSVTVKMETMVMNNLTKGEEVEDEEERTKHRTLGDSLAQGSCVGGAVVDENELVPVSEV